MFELRSVIGMMFKADFHGQKKKIARNFSAAFNMFMNIVFKIYLNQLTETGK